MMNLCLSFLKKANMPGVRKAPSNDIKSNSRALLPKSVSIGEISLTGQIKPANQIGICIKEVEKFGLEHVFVAKTQQIKSSCNLLGFASVYDLLRLFPEQTQ
jgi:predicted ATP-dependent serine protease